MSLKYAILVLLENQPGSGYDLAQRFKSGIGNFWHATHQQVYQELKKLRAGKLVALEEKSESDRADKKVYRITKAGHRALQAWFQQPSKPPGIKQPLLIKVFGAHLTERKAMVAEIEKNEATHRRLLDEYQAMEQKYFEQDESVRRQYRLPYLTLRCGIRYERAWLEWLEEARTLIAEDALPKKPVLETRRRDG
jgi:PadR family transcriptional regulator AphA